MATTEPGNRALQANRRITGIADIAERVIWVRRWQARMVLSAGLELTSLSPRECILYPAGTCISGEYADLDLSTRRQGIWMQVRHCLALTQDSRPGITMADGLRTAHEYPKRLASTPPSFFVIKSSRCGCVGRLEWLKVAPGYSCSRTGQWL